MITYMLLLYINYHFAVTTVSKLSFRSYYGKEIII